MFRIITNSFFENCGQAVMTSGGSFIDFDNNKTLNLTDGPRHLYYTSATTGDRRFLYKSTNAPQTYDAVVVVNADLHNGRDVSIRDTDNIGDNTRFSEASFAQTLVGPTAKDFVYLATTPHENVTRVEFRLNSSYIKTIHQVYAGKSVAVAQVLGYSRTPVSRLTKVFIGRQMYQIQERITIDVEGVSDELMQEIASLPRIRKSPFFIYDPTGQWFSEKLFHVVMENNPISKRFNNLNDLSFSFLVLRYER